MNDIASNLTEEISHKPVNPFLFTILILPMGVSVGYVSVTLGYLLSEAGVSVEKIAALVGVTMLPHVARKLSETMRRNTKMKVMVATGYFDLICPFFDAEYTFSRNGLEREKIKMNYYEAGHMIYLHETDFIKLSNYLREFLSN